MCLCCLYYIQKKNLQFGKSLLGDETLLSQERQYSKWRLHLFGFSLIWNRPWKQVEQWPPKIGLSTNIPSHIVEIRLPRAHPVLAVPDCNWHEEQDWRFIDGAWEPTLWRILVEVEGLMVLQVQAVMGQGSRKRKADQMAAGLNLLGNSLKTRMLFSVLLGRLCSGQKLQNYPLLALVNHLCLQLQALSRRDFIQHRRSEIENTVLYLVPLATKQDRPAFSKIGCLMNHHNTLSTTTEAGMGVCHLCNGGVAGHAAWRSFFYYNMVPTHTDVPVP